MELRCLSQTVNITVIFLMVEPLIPPLLRKKKQTLPKSSLSLKSGLILSAKPVFFSARISFVDKTRGRSKLSPLCVFSTTKLKGNPNSFYSLANLFFTGFGSEKALPLDNVYFKHIQTMHHGTSSCRVLIPRPLDSAWV